MGDSSPQLSAAAQVSRAVMGFPAPVSTAAPELAWDLLLWHRSSPGECSMQHRWCSPLIHQRLCLSASLPWASLSPGTENNPANRPRFLWLCSRVYVEIPLRQQREKLGSPVHTGVKWLCQRCGSSGRQRPCWWVRSTPAEVLAAMGLAWGKPPGPFPCVDSAFDTFERGEGGPGG